MTKSLAVALIWLLVIGGMFACVASMKSNGATDHPLLVNSAVTMGGDGEANRLYSPCQITPKNLPAKQNRDA